MKYDEYELLELFENEPSFVCKYDEYFTYHAFKQEFEMLLSLDVFRDECEIFLVYAGITVFSGRWEHVTLLKKHEDYLIILIENIPTIRLNFKNYLGIDYLSREAAKMYAEIL